ncbi:MAG: TonB-dependent receptor [Pseudomonadota bacterium]
MKTISLSVPVAIMLAFTITAKAQTEIEEIIVTAQKRSESLQDVPVTMQAYSGEQIRTLRISRASDITKLAPNLSLSTQNTASRQINIRGVGTSDFFGNSTGSVGIYMDEVTMSAPYLTGLGLYDMERVEILRGPQNALFGRNTTAGAVNYISKLPSPGEENEGFIDIIYGNFKRIEIEGAYSFSLSDDVAVRIAGKSYDRDGIWNNLGDNGAEHGEKDRKSFRATLVWTPSEVTSITANFHWADEDSDFDPIKAVGTRARNGSPEFGVDGIPRPIFGSVPARSPNLDFNQVYDSFNAQGNNPSTNNWEDVYVTGTYLHQIETQGAYFKLEHDFDFATFTAISSWDKSEVLWTYETGGIGNNTGTAVTTCQSCIFLNGASADNSPQVTLGLEQDQYYKQFSQELRLVSPSDRALRWIAGLYYFTEDSELMQSGRFGAAAFDLSQRTDLAGRFPGQAIGGFFGSFPLIGVPFGNRLAYQYAELENTVWSPYLQIEYDLTETVALTAGLRFTSDEKTVPFNQVGNLNTLGDPITTVYETELILARATQNTLACDLDGDGNNTFVGSGGRPTNTRDNRGLLCTQNLDRDKLDFNEVGGKLGLDWRVTEEILMYGSFSRGFRSGKHDIHFLDGPHTGFLQADLEPETLDAYEIGVKSDLMNSALQLNAAAYFYTWENQQTVFVSPVTGPAFVNIPESDLYGLELELKWAVGNGWFVSAGLGLQDSEIQSSTDERFVQVGHELPFVAKSSANIFLLKETQLGQGLLTVQGDWQYRSAAKAYARDIGADPTTNFIDELERVSQFNVRISYLFGDDEEYEVAIFGENLTENETCAYKWDLTGIAGTTYCVANEAKAFYGLQGLMRF